MLHFPLLHWWIHREFPCRSMINTWTKTTLTLHRTDELTIDCRGNTAWQMLRPILSGWLLSSAWFSHREFQTVVAEIRPCQTSGEKEVPFRVPKNPIIFPKIMSTVGKTTYQELRFTICITTLNKLIRTQILRFG